MKNSPSCRRRIYAPRGTVNPNRVRVGLDASYLAQCKAVDEAENKTDAAYVLEVYLEGQAERRKHRPVMDGLEAK